MHYDVIVPVAKKDYEIAKTSIPYILKYFEPDAVVVISSPEIETSLFHDFQQNDKIVFKNENELYANLTFENIFAALKKYNAEEKTAWYFQQFLKMAYSFISQNEFYLSWDSDMIPLRKIDFFSPEGIPLFSTKEEYNKPYFDTIYNLFGLNKCIEKSFIAEHMMFKKSIMVEMLNVIETKGHKEWFMEIIDSINPKQMMGSGFSEFETYGTYTMNFHKEEYGFKKIKAVRLGKEIFGTCPSENVIHWLGKEFDTLSFEKWDRQFISWKPYENAMFRHLVNPFLFVKCSFEYVKIINLIRKIKGIES